MEGPTPTLVIMVDGVGVDIASRPLVIENNLAISIGPIPQCQFHGQHKTCDSHPWAILPNIRINPSMPKNV